MQFSLLKLVDHGLKRIRHFISEPLFHHFHVGHFNKSIKTIRKRESHRHVIFNISSYLSEIFQKLIKKPKFKRKSACTILII